MARQLIFGNKDKKNVKKEIKTWLAGRPHPKQEKINLIKNLEEIQEEMEREEVTREMLLREREIDQKNSVIQGKVEMDLRLKSRCLWLKASD